MDQKSLKVLEFNQITGRLVESCVSEVGKAIARDLVPSCEPSEIRQRQEETSEAQQIILTRGQLPMGPIHQVTEYAKRASVGGILDPIHLMRIGDTLRTSAKVKNFLKASEGTPILQSLSEQLTALRELEEDIERSILSEEEISDNASGELRRIRRSIASLKEQVRQKLQSMVSSSAYAKYLQESIVTMRQERFVIPVKAENRSHVPGIVHDSSSSGATLFIEPMVIVEMNNKLREEKIKEHEEIERILAELSAQVGEHAAEIATNEKIMAKIDFIMAKGKLSVSMKGQEPFINDKQYIDLRNARHPMIAANKVVPLNISVGKDYSSLVITGPNTGGKTVSLKTVGLLCVMAQSGLHLPADYGTSVCVFQDIFADIGDEQSIEQSLSTFSSHMTHIVDILGKVQSDSLVLFDELGAGTDPLEGAALAVAILEHLRKRSIRTIATTHYSELKHYALTTEKVENASVEFDVATLSPTYRLLIGVPGKSNAFEISKKLGLSEEIIDSANACLEADDIAMEDVLKEIEENRKKTEEQRLEAEKILEEAKFLEQKINNRQARTEEQKLKILEEAKREARNIVREAKETSEKALKELRKLMKHAGDSGAGRRAEAIRGELREIADKFGVKPQELLREQAVRKPVKKLKAGDEVYVPSFAKQGSVVSVDENKKEALVQIGIMKMNLPISALEESTQQRDEIKSSGAGRIMKSKAQEIKTEIDLRGLDTESARVELDKYIDNAYLSGIPRVTVIHGIGTMVVKNMVKSFLKKNKYVKSYRDGVYGEGGAGVTIVEFKS